MTVKELAEFTGKQKTTVRGWVRKASTKYAVLAIKYADASPSKPADFNINDVELILNESSLGNNAISIVMANARKQPQQNVAIASANATFDYEAIGEMIGTALTVALAPIVEKLTGTQKKEALQIEAPKISPRASIRKTINEYVAKTGTEYADAYNALYRDYGYRMGCNVCLCAKNRDIKTIDYIEQIGKIEVLEAIAKDYFKETD